MNPFVPLSRARLRSAAVLASALLVAAGLTSVSTSVQAATVTRTVSGVVVAADTGRPLAGIDVLLKETTLGGIFGMGVTDSRGAYSIALPAVQGSLYIEVSTFRQEKYVQETDLPAFPVTTTSASVRRSASIATGATLTGHITLPDRSAAAQSGFASAVDETGKSVGTGSYTDDEGNYRIARLPAGAFKVRLTGDSAAPRYAGGAATTEKASSFPISSGQIRELGDTELVGGARVVGTLTVDDDEYFNGLVTLASVSSPEQDTYTSTTENDGLFELGPVAPGTYTLQFGPNSPIDPHIRQYTPGTIDRSRAERITVVGTETVTRNLAVPLGATLSGTVTTPAAGTLIATAYSQDPVTGAWDQQRTGYNTGAKTAYTINGLAPGKYRIGFASRSGAVITTPEFFDDVRTIDRAKTVDVVGTRSVTGIDAALTAGGPVLAFSVQPVPVVTGKAKVGSTLSASPGTWSPAATSFTYQWKRGGTVIAGATKQTYELSGADKGTALTVTVRASRAGYASVSRTSAPTTAVAPGTITISSVATTGTRSVGATQKSTVAVSPSNATLSYRWNRDGAAISGATGATYKLTAADGGRVISLRVTATLTGYSSAVRTSASFTAAKALTAAPTPTITGTAKVGKKLAAATGTWSPSPVTLTYQWKRNGVAIGTATQSTYVVTAADRGARLTVVVTGSKSGYATAAKSSAPVLAG